MKIVTAGCDLAALVAATLEPLMPNSRVEPIDNLRDAVKLFRGDTIAAGFKQ